MTRRYPIEESALVRHIDGRVGRVVELVTVQSLPGAKIEWLRGGTEVIPLGYVCRADAEAAQ